MGNSKAIEIDSGPQVLERLVTALQYYVDSQFPPGSSDCGQVAREELLNVVAALRASLEARTPASYSRRMRAMLKEGIRVYFEYLEQRDGFAHRHECELLQAASRGASAADEDLQAARARDQAGSA
jgi:hypothetical protein